MSDVRMEGLTLKGSLSVGGGGTNDYNKLINKPTYEGNTIEGDLTASDLGIATSEALQTTNTNVGNLRTDLQTETTNRSNADNNLQNQIDGLVAKSDVVDIVGTYADLQNYDTSTLGNNDIVKVLNDSTHDNTMSYYRWNLTTWVYVGSEGAYYTKSESDSRYVPITRTVNGKALSQNISLDYTDVGALSDNTVIPDKTSDLTNDSNYQNATQVSASISSALSGYATETWVQNYIASLNATNTRY